MSLYLIDPGALEAWISRRITGAQVAWRGPTLQQELVGALGPQRILLRTDRRETLPDEFAMRPVDQETIELAVRADHDGEPLLVRAGVRTEGMMPRALAAEIAREETERLLDAITLALASRVREPRATEGRRASLAATLRAPRPRPPSG